MERHRLWRKDRFASFVHRVNLPFEPARGAHRSKLAGGVDYHIDSVIVSRCHPADACDKGSKDALTDAHGVGLASNARDIRADNNIAITASESGAGAGPYCNVTGAGIVGERAETNGHVVVAG